MDRVVEKPWYIPRKPEEIIAYPWLHIEAVEYLEALLRPEWKVLEHGAGGSTLWLAERVAKVVSVEHGLDWREMVRNLAPANVTLLEKIPGSQRIYEMFFIDGQHDERGYCITLAPEMVVPGGWVVLDNANRPEYEYERSLLPGWAKLAMRFDNNIAISHYFVTEFWQLCE